MNDGVQILTGCLAACGVLLGGFVAVSDRCDDSANVCSASMSTPAPIMWTASSHPHHKTGPYRKGCGTPKCAAGQQLGASLSSKVKPTP